LQKSEQPYYLLGKSPLTFSVSFHFPLSTKVHHLHNFQHTNSLNFSYSFHNLRRYVRYSRKPFIYSHESLITFWYYPSLPFIPGSSVLQCYSWIIHFVIFVLRILENYSGFFLCKMKQEKKTFLKRHYSYIV
jgi:hypothetical protein